jgi:hypothetical protein
MPTFNLKPEFLRAASIGRPIGVDREKGIIRGYVVAQRGPFKSEGRGEFDDDSLASIVRLMSENTLGTKSRFGHPTESDDGLGKYLGRAKEPRLDGDRVRADLHLNPASRSSPNGDLGGYVMDLAESDPDAFSSSLVLRVKKEYRLNPDGTKQVGTNGEPLPPLWRPEKIHATDVVDTGDAVDGLLSHGVDVDGLPLAALWRGTELLNSILAGQPREVTEERLMNWVARYLDERYGERPAGVSVDLLRRRLTLKLKNMT